MTREIKFRFWDKDNEEMSEVCKLGDDLRWLHSDMHVPLQYTGLKDKNGVEIYEGDIVQIYKHMSNKKVAVHVVEWDDKECRYKGIYPNIAVWSQHEVIGNIYENPEILI